MLSFTIDGSEYLFPAGYADIILRDYMAFMEVVGLPPHSSGQKPMIRTKPSLLDRIKGKTQELKTGSNTEPIPDSEAISLEYMAQFINFWGNVPLVLIERMLDSDIFGMYVTINNHWLPFTPTEGITTFLHDGRLWSIDYSLDAITSIKDPQELQSIMSSLCKSSSGGVESPRYWGGVSLANAISVVVELKRRHRIIASAIGASIINSMTGKGAMNG